MAAGYADAQPPCQSPNAVAPLATLHRHSAGAEWRRLCLFLVTIARAAGWPEITRPPGAPVEIELARRRRSRSR